MNNPVSVMKMPGDMRACQITLDELISLDELRKKQVPWLLLVPTPVAPRQWHTHVRLDDPSGQWVGYAAIHSVEADEGNDMKTWVGLGPVTAGPQ